MQVATIEFQPKRHSQTGGSGYHRWRSTACPGSVNQIRNFAPPELDIEDEVRDDGIEAHGLAEALLKERAKGKRGVIKARFGNNGGDVDMLIAVSRYVDYVDYLADVPNAILQVEETFNLDWLATSPVYDENGVYEGEESCLYGTSDAVVYVPELKYFDPNINAWFDGPVLHVIDLKYGFKRVDAKQNPQGMYYALGAYHRFRSQGLEVKRIVIHIYQPRVRGLEEEFLTWSCDEATLEAFALQLRDDVEATQERDAPLNADKEWCRLCKARVNCPEVAKPGYELASLQLINLGKDPAKELPPLEVLMHDKAALYRVAQLAKVFAEGVLERTRVDMNRGERYTGLKLVNGVNKRVLTNLQAFEQEFPVADWPDLYTESKPLSAPSILAHLSENFDEVRLKDFEQRYVRKLPGDPLVALASDPRKEYSAVAKAQEEWSEEIAEAKAASIPSLPPPPPPPNITYPVTPLFAPPPPIAYGTTKLF